MCNPRTPCLATLIETRVEILLRVSIIVEKIGTCVKKMM